ncbi:MAG: Fic family protein [Rhizomicrobium sp.]
MSTPGQVIWVPKLAVLGMHQDSLTLFGGLPGIRDEGALDAALARPQHKQACENSLAQLAAAYAFGVTKNPPFIDGNKRTALACLIAFAGLNQYRLVADKITLTHAMLALSGSELSEGDFATFVANHLQPH